MPILFGQQIWKINTMKTKFKKGDLVKVVPDPGGRSTRHMNKYGVVVQTNIWGVNGFRVDVMLSDGHRRVFASWNLEKQQ